VFFNGRRIRASRLDLDSSRITFRLTPRQFSRSDPQRLGLAAAPFRPGLLTESDAPRELALPVSSIVFRRVDGDGRS
jgi:hypothetical protein